MSNYYVTTPIYYVNDKPHIGTAYTTLAADVLARFNRLMNREVNFLTGTDEHGQKVEQSAIKANCEPQEFTDQVSANFRLLFDSMNISYDYFIRTTDKEHKKTVTKFWKILKEKGDIYLGSYKGWYCVRDEAFYRESELIDGKAPTGASVEWVEEPSYFFKLSKWQDRLLEFYEQNPDFVKPTSRFNEVINFVKSGLQDLSVSRTSLKWGIPVPEHPEHIVYVWLDALTNYISAINYTQDQTKFDKFWPANVHIVGKDILRFHAVYWPAFLMAANIALPKHIFAHGWWTNDGQKISKSLGNTVDPTKLMDEFGLDPIRYYLMREVNFGNDGNFSRTTLINRINSELVNKIGNLIQRTLTLIYRNNNGKLPDLNHTEIDLEYCKPLLAQAVQTANLIPNLFEKFEINKVLDLIIEFTDTSNLYIDNEAPWLLVNVDQFKMLKILYSLAEAIRYLGIMLKPFIPNSAEKILDQLSILEDQRQWKHLTQEFALVGGNSIIEPQILFPRIKL